MLIALSVGAGIFAYQNTLSEAFESWQRRHHPSLGAWQASLQSRGFGAITSNAALQKLLRKLPTTVDSSGSAWGAEGLRWIVIFPDDSSGQAPSLFCYGSCEQAPDHWEPQGGSWMDFDRVMAQIDQNRVRWASVARPARTSEYEDPRAIRY